MKRPALHVEVVSKRRIMPEGNAHACEKAQQPPFFGSIETIRNAGRQVTYSDEKRELQIYGRAHSRTLPPLPRM
jgi:hypothetical protein